jgi:hypothetical protein
VVIGKIRQPGLCADKCQQQLLVGLVIGRQGPSVGAMGFFGSPGNIDRVGGGWIDNAETANRVSNLLDLLL